MGRNQNQNWNTPKNYGGSYTAPPPENFEGNEPPRKFILKEKIADMLKYGLPLVDQFPRRNRKLGDEMKSSMLEMLRLAVRLERKYYKKTTLEDLDIELAVLREFVVMASEKEYCGPRFAPPLSIHQREVWAKHNTEIGNLIGGYKKSIKK